MAQQTSSEEYTAVGELVRIAPDQIAAMLDKVSTDAAKFLQGMAAFRTALQLMLKDVADIQVPTEGGVIAASELTEYKEAIRLLAGFDRAVGDE
jgi:hypothetical protein